MKKLLFTLLMLISIAYCQPHKQKAKPKTTAIPSGQTPPTAPPKPTPRKIKQRPPESLGIEKDLTDLLPIRPKDTVRTITKSSGQSLPIVPTKPTQSQLKEKKKDSIKTTTKPFGQTPPTVPTKPTQSGIMEKKKDSIPTHKN